MHAEVSGTVDFYEKDDPACLKRLRSLVAHLAGSRSGEEKRPKEKIATPAKNPDAVYDLVQSRRPEAIRRARSARPRSSTRTRSTNTKPITARHSLPLTRGSADTPSASLRISAMQVRTKKAGIQMGGVIYSDSADKAARFVMDCNQTGLPIIFFQDVTGFMVGRDAEQSGIIRSGAKLVNAVSNSVVPKITVVVGGSFGAGNYALCGKAYDPRFILAWPNARYAVMGAAQASDTVFSVLAKARERGDKKASRRRTGTTSRESERNLRRANRHSLWRGARLGRRHHSTARNARRLVRLCYVSRPMPHARFHSGVIQV